MEPLKCHRLCSGRRGTAAIASTTGGTPEAITALDTSKKEFSHRFPAFLPDGEHFLFATLPAKNGAFDIYAGSLGGSSRTFVGALETAPVYADPGWLLYGRQGVLNARPFDARTRMITGDPIPLDDQPTSILDPTVSFTRASDFRLNDRSSGVLLVRFAEHHGDVVRRDGTDSGDARPAGWSLRDGEDLA